MLYFGISCREHTGSLNKVVPSQTDVSLIIGSALQAITMTPSENPDIIRLCSNAESGSLQLDGTHTIIIKTVS